MKIEEVTIRNFKSFSAANPKTTGFANINMIYGNNNSGKSNFIKFIELIFKTKVIVNPVKYEEMGKEKIRMDRILLNFWEGNITEMPFIFINDNRNTHIEFEFGIRMEHKEMGKFVDKLKNSYLTDKPNYAIVGIKGYVEAINPDTSKIVLVEVQLNKKPIFQIAKKSIFPKSKDLNGNQEAYNEFLRLFNDCILFLENDRNLMDEYKSFEQQKYLTSSNFKNWLFGYFMESQRHGEFIDFCKFLKKYEIIETSNQELVDLGFSTFGDKIDVMLKTGQKRLPLSNYGTGIHQLFYILAKIYFNKSKIILIEELELNLSPQTQKKLFEILKDLINTKKIDQVFFTTHSPYFNYRKDFSVFKTTIDENGITNISGSNKTLQRKFFVEAWALGD